MLSILLKVCETGDFSCVSNVNGWVVDGETWTTELQTQ